MAANVGDQRSTDWLVGLGEHSPLCWERGTKYSGTSLHSLEEEIHILGARVEGQASHLSFLYVHAGVYVCVCECIIHTHVGQKRHEIPWS